MESLPALFGPPNENPWRKQENVGFIRNFLVERFSIGKAILKEEERSFSESLQVHRTVQGGRVIVHDRDRTGRQDLM